MNSHSLNVAAGRPIAPHRLGRAVRFLGRKLDWLKPRYTNSDWERTVRAAYAGAKDTPSDAPLVVVQGVEDIFYFSLFGEIVKGMRRNGPIRAELLVPRSLASPAEGGGWRYLMRSAGRWLYSNPLTDRKWIHLFKAYVNGIAYRSASALPFGREAAIAAEADRLWKGLKSKDGLLSLTVSGIPIGDLVADSYLRLRPSPELKLSDPFLRTVIRQAIRDIDKGFAYFGKKRPALFLTSYTSYVHHGVPARVAACLNVRVQSFGSYWDFTKKITFADSNHLRGFDCYKREFERMKDCDEKSALGCAKLAERLDGKIDDGVVYMRKSHYGAPDQDIPDVRGAVIVFLPDFYDSPHCYRWMLFHDFWEWICFTIETLRAANIPFIIKQHPNAVSESADDVARLMAMYPGLRLLPASISNRQLVEGGMSCAVTVYGSVTAEMAYMGVPTINCADNPHVSFNFGHTARTRDEYRAMLEGYASLPRELSRMRYEAGAFYYMHFLNLPPDQTEIRDKFIQNNARNVYSIVNDVWDAKQILKGFADLASAPGFRSFVHNLSTDVRAAFDAASHS